MIKIVSNQKKIYYTFDTITPIESLDILNSLNHISLDSETEGFDPYRTP